MIRELDVLQTNAYNYKCPCDYSFLAYIWKPSLLSLNPDGYSMPLLISHHVGLPDSAPAALEDSCLPELSEVCPRLLKVSMSWRLSLGGYKTHF